MAEETAGERIREFAKLFGTGLCRFAKNDSSVLFAEPIALSALGYELVTFQVENLSHGIIVDNNPPQRRADFQRPERARSLPHRREMGPRNRPVLPRHRQRSGPPNLAPRCWLRCASRSTQSTRGTESKQRTLTIHRSRRTHHHHRSRLRDRAE